MELAQLGFLACVLLLDGVSSAREDVPLRSSGLLSRRATDVAKWTEDLFERVGEGGALIEDPSLEEE
jgi:hypothetical protein